MDSTLKHETFSGDGKSQSCVPKNRIADLEGLCLSVIISDFDRYSAAYKLTNSSVPAEHFEFLARRYSELLFTSLKRNMTLKAEHFEFLINPHLKELDVVNIDQELLPPLADKVKRGNNVQCCKAKSRNSTETQLYTILLSSLERLEVIEYGGDASDALIKSIGKSCPHLKVLLLESMEFYDVESSYYHCISDVITGCPYLEIFQHTDSVGAIYRMYASSMPFMKTKECSSLNTANRYRLKTLSSKRHEFSKYSLSDALEICAVVCPNVSCLHIDHLKSTEELEKCLLFPLLEDITFELMSNMSDTAMHNFFSITGKKLISLDIPYTKWLSLPDLIESCPNLESFTLRSSRFCYTGPTGNRWSEDLPCIARLPRLRSLKIQDASFFSAPDAKALRLLLSFAKGTTKLSLKGCLGLTNELFRTFSLYHVYELDLSNSDIRGEPLQDILLHGRIRKLVLNYCANITPTDFFTLSSCQSNVDIIWFYYDAVTSRFAPRRFPCI